MSLPYFPYYAKDAHAKVMHLSLAEEGAYIRLKRLCWFSPDGTIPADETWIFRKMIIRCEEEKHAVRNVLGEFFTQENGRFFNKKLCLVMLEQNEAHARRVSAGKKGGKSKSLKTNNSTPSNAKAKPKQPKPEPEPYIQQQFRPARLNPKTKTAKLVDQCLSPDEIELQLEKFISHHTEKKTRSADFNRQWRTWMQRQVQWKLERKANHGRNRTTSKSIEEIGERRRDEWSAVLEGRENDRLAS